MLTEPRPNAPSRTRPRPGRRRWPWRWYELLPEAVLGLGLTIFLVDEPDAATSAFRSSRALTLMAVTGAAWVAARVLLLALVRWRSVHLGLFAAGAAAILAVVVLPAYDDDTVVETLPGAAPAAPSQPTTTTVADSATPTSTAGPTTPTTPTTAAPTTTTTAPPAGPVLVRVGSLEGIDHRAEGTVAVYRQPTGRYVVGLEAFDIQPGPDYDVYVVPGARREDVDGGVRLDDLRGNRGTQYYEVPEGVALEDGDWTVLVWCQTFDVPVAGATPAAP